jgi:substrate import-associated zinc metallohydrolase lipoprotein
MTMKKYLIYILVASLATCLYSCSEDELKSESVIKITPVVKNDFDVWLGKNYSTPYNIAFKYRMEDIESSMNYNLVPAKYEQSIKMAKLVKHLCLEAYDEVAGPDFMKLHFPKMIHLIGSGAYNSNGTVVLGTAEGGLKITLYLINSLDPTNVERLNEYYFRTIHHEFSHILHQKKEYPVEFKKISELRYINDSWNTLADSTALKIGFITPYSSKEANEDFAEIVAQYVTHTEAEWQALLVRAARPLYGKEITTQKPLDRPGNMVISEKLEIVSNYLKNTWAVDLKQLRSVILRRSGEIGTLDLDNLK